MSFGLDRPQVIQSIPRSGTRPVHDCDPVDAWGHLLEQVQPFSGQRSWGIRKAGGVTAGASHADDEALAHWIRNEQEYDWPCTGLVKESSSSRGAATENDIRP